MTKRAIVLLGLLAFPALAHAQDQSATEEAREHYTQAEMYMKAGVYDLAIKEYRKGYKLTPSAHGFLFNIGLAYEKMGDKAKAVEAFEQYLEKEPKGKKAAEARARSVALRRAIEVDAKTAADKKNPPGDGSDRDKRTGKSPGSDSGGGKQAPDGTGGTGLDLTRNNNDALLDPNDTKPSSGRSWTLISAGVAFVVAGVIADLGPDSGNNGKVDAIDFLPVGLYGVGALLVYRGVF